MTLKNEIKRDVLKKKCIKKINSLPNHRTKKMDINLLEFICNKIENGINKKNKINKLELLYEILESCFDKLSELDKTTIQQNVDYLIISKAICKTPISRKIYKFFKNLFKKKLNQL